MKLIELKHLFEDVELRKEWQVLVIRAAHDLNKLVEGRVTEHLKLILDVVR